MAFEARWFQPSHHELPSKAFLLTDNDRFTHPSNLSALHFRAETDTFWEASECCLIHADLSAMASSILDIGETGIYMNPYVRVAYSASILPWLSFTKRFERLYPPIHTLVNWIANRPSFNPRQRQEPGDTVVNDVWHWDTAMNAMPGEVGGHPRGHFAEVTRKALPGGFCGMRKMSYMDEGHTMDDKSRHWITEKAPIIG